MRRKDKIFSEYYPEIKKKRRGKIRKRKNWKGKQRKKKEEEKIEEEKKEENKIISKRIEKVEEEKKMIVILIKLMKINKMIMKNKFILI